MTEWQVVHEDLTECELTQCIEKLVEIRHRCDAMIRSLEKPHEPLHDLNALGEVVVEQAPMQ